MGGHGHSGRLAQFNETQMQEDFLTQIFGGAPGYTQPTENAEAWDQAQHAPIAGQTPMPRSGDLATANPAPRPPSSNSRGRRPTSTATARTAPPPSIGVGIISTTRHL